LNWITDKVLPKFKALVKNDSSEEILWIKCKSCEQMIFHKEHDSNLNVCKSCGYHDFIKIENRTKLLLDEGTIENIQIDNIKDDPLDFKDLKNYSDRLKVARNKTNSYDAVSIKFGLIKKKPCVILLFDFSFMGGSMGRYVGDAIIKAVNTAIKKDCALLIIPSSGGARMQEGILSLMQMPRSVVAIQKLKEKKLPYIVLLSNPTTGGVTASFAMLGDVHLAEPGSVIGFAGRRVIEETVKEKLPDNFQKSEDLHEHGMIDRVVERKNQKKEITQILDFFQK
jgi:acetyl-CoA carboxylase carboxyl transferase subunit beta